MTRRRREKRRAAEEKRAARDRADFRQDAEYLATLRRFQLAAAAVMLVGLTTATLVCAGEFKLPWLVASGGGVFLLGLVGYFVAPPAARWWSRRI